MSSGASESIGGDPPIMVDRQLGFLHPANRDALAYWRSKSRDRAMPSRAQIDPIDMRGFLANVGLAEVTIEPRGAPRYRIRLAGTIIEEVFGPVTGQPLDEALPPPIAERWRRIFDVAFAARAPIRATTRVIHEGKSFLTAEVLMAPLSEDEKTISMLFASGAFWTDDNVPSG
jgi:hypothetical protein